MKTIPTVDKNVIFDFSISLTRKDEPVTPKEVQKNKTQLIFNKLELKDVPLLKSYFDLYRSKSCDFSVGGILLWKDMFDYELAEIDNILIFKGYLPQNNVFVFYYLNGSMEFENYYKLISTYCHNKNIKAIILVPESQEVTSEKIKEFECKDYLEEFKEYLYPIEKFCGFPGKKMEKKRNHLHYFEKNYQPYNVEEISQSNISELIDFTLHYEDSHDETPTAIYECKQVIYALNNFHFFPFEGIAIRKEDKIIGFSFGEVIGDTFIIHAEKGDISFRGIYQKIASEQAHTIARKYPYIKWLNREDDMGDENLRQSKESYHPVMYVRKRIISLY